MGAASPLIVTPWPASRANACSSNRGRAPTHARQVGSSWRQPVLPAPVSTSTVAGWPQSHRLTCTERTRCRE